MMLVLGVAAVFLASAPVARWSSAVPIEADEIAYSDQGVVVRPTGEILPVVIPWYDVRSVPDSWAGDAAAYQDISQLARDARQRRQRGDIRGAAKLYTQLDQKLTGVRGEQAFDIAIGLLEYNLLGEDHAAAVLPWLRVLRAAGTGRQYQGPLLDERTSLHPALIPLFLNNSGQNLVPNGEFSPREQLLLEYYQIAIAHDEAEDIDSRLDELEQRIRKLGDRDAGLLLVHEIVSATRASDPAKRLAAREQLDRTARSADVGWMIDWSKLAIGASLISEDDENQRERGVVACIGVVVDPEDGTPNSIRELAASFAAKYLDSTNRSQYANIITMTALMGNQPATGATP
ncbi:MAG: hypothetical protein KC996_08715 [Phycisphaerales bacterium]|nr:hypothetical protein [Phycisphaerales bacterium]